MLSVLLTQFVLIWAVIDPIGSIPVYLSQTHHLSPHQRRLVAIKAILIATGILLFFVIVGQVITTSVMLSVLVITLILLLGASKIQRYIGDVGAAIISRVMGLILAAVALNNLLIGIRDFYLAS
ncbi:hypothetical protein ETN89_04410 [Photobacterium damselae subsp. damselae]|uniref:MarC family protein n=1 Tax=Photobacterium damselae TaxID=38293 RepID=UPI000A2FC708|nr:MarC family protein [Photobacterium damselae]ARR48230.1 hypothetical protein CAY62_00625 [Photobacterium damselae subsp. damselae]QAY34724.1 hypothetical protein ETN89_04410 [Photobacterium damselae subsp. damselae]